MADTGAKPGSDGHSLALVTANLRECAATGDLDVDSLADDLDALLRPLS